MTDEDKNFAIALGKLLVIDEAAEMFDAEFIDSHIETSDDAAYKHGFRQAVESIQHELKWLREKALEALPDQHQ